MTDTVYIQRLTSTADGAGGYSQAWVTVATARGRVSANTGARAVSAGKESVDYDVVITLPYDANVTEADMLQVDGVQYTIVSIPPRSEKTATRVFAKQ